jgi:hypothetical protein
MYQKENKSHENICFKNFCYLQMFYNFFILNYFFRRHFRFEGNKNSVEPLLRNPRLPRLRQVGRGSDVFLRHVFDASVDVAGHDVEDRLRAQVLHLGGAVDATVNDVHRHPTVGRGQHFGPVKNRFSWNKCKKKQELLGQFSSTVEQNCIIKKDDLRAKNL